MSSTLQSIKDQKECYENSFQQQSETVVENTIEFQQQPQQQQITFDLPFPNPKKVEPSVALPPLFRTASHDIDNYKKNKVNLVDPKVKFANVSYHCEDPNWIAENFNSNLSFGLSLDNYQFNLKKFGENIQSPPSKNLLRKIFMYFFGGFGALLLIAGVLCCVCWKPLGNPNPSVSNLALGIILLIIFILQATFNFIQDYSSSNVMKSINNLVPTECSIIRNGEYKIIDSKLLVPGDIINLTAGNKLPADVRIFNCSSDLAIDRAILTGEAIPLQASSKNDSKESNYLESNRIGLQGTFIVSGSGQGIIVSTGDNTVFGSIAKLTSKPKSGLTPIQKEIFRFIAITTFCIIILDIVVIILWAVWIRHSYPNWISVANLIVDIVSVAVSFIPEGLPIALTTCLIITAKQMKKNKILCKSLSTVESLGSISVLCFDKTGTITKNNMTVTNVFKGLKEIDIKNFGLNNDFSKSTTNHLLTISSLCNDSLISNDGVLTGNATDKAIFKFSSNIKSKSLFQDNWKTIFEIAFNSKDKYMAKLVEPVDKSDFQSFNKLGYDENDYNIQNSGLLLVKGAPDIILEKCKYAFTDDDDDSESTIKEIDYEMKAKIESIKDAWSRQGKRVILLASMIIDNSKLDFNNGSDTKELIQSEINLGKLYLVGLIGIQDPPRKNIESVIDKLRDAGIKVAMITGDFELTGLEIARQVHIVTKQVDKYENLINFTEFSIGSDDDDNNNDDNVEYLMLNKKERVTVINRALSLTGKDIDALTDFEWKRVVRYSELVCTRTTPEHKLLIIQQFQKFGAIIGMTGDGVNDSPSLKQADVGISLIDASDIAKEASDLILMNDDEDLEDALFNSIIEALKYGRLVFENLRKTIAYLLPAGTFAELWPVLLNITAGMPQMLSSFNMIIICCITDCIGAVFIAYEPCESNLLKKKPRSISGERLVDWKLFLHSYFTIGTFYAFTSFMVSFINLQRHGFKFSDFNLSYGSYNNLKGIDKIINMSSSIYFVNLVIMQFFNLMAMRTRYLSFFQLNLLKDNRFIYLTIPIGLGTTFIINYIPAIQSALGTEQVPVEYYFIALGFGIIVISYDEFRKGMVRRYPKRFFARISW
ncbi:hypothetical protein C6P40_001814 [Pichia californica]|uniref:Cation-transporting P-type ATPase N-terminal domain-containing protein n=1 Tax=Pichia californica TaxID=460514 RepID=A0A9P7BHZ0_9ASCO|nr:hypothetical protein C6P42_002228 [[Candida] californica]KAG0690724.1 hypothetical protein C6P40_001814 [[Candida] californica]